MVVDVLCHKSTAAVRAHRSKRTVDSAKTPSLRSPVHKQQTQSQLPTLRTRSWKINVLTASRSMCLRMSILRRR